MTQRRPDRFRDRFAGAALCVAFCVCAPVAQAEDVTVQSVDGGFEVSGRVVHYDGRFLSLMSVYGELTLDYAGVMCVGMACPDAQDYVPSLAFAGDADMAQIYVPALVEGFARSRGWRVALDEAADGTLSYQLWTDPLRPELRLRFSATTSDAGFAALLNREVGVALMTRPLRSDEAEAAREAGLGEVLSTDQSALLGLGGLSIIASPSLPIDGISLQDVAAVYSGDITNWSDLGGPDLPISVHGLMPAVGTDEVVHRVVLGGDQGASDVFRHPDFGAVVAAVSQARDAIGFAPFNSVGNARNLPIVQGCDLSARATVQGIKTEDYPLTYPLYLYFDNRRNAPVVDEFLDWLRSPSAQLILRRAGVVSQDPIPIPLSTQGERLAAAIEAAGADVSLADLQDMIGTLIGQVRLSLTFRFEEGQRDMDVQSQFHAAYLAQSIAEGLYDGRRLTLVGFTDADGSAAANRALSVERAEAVRDAVFAYLEGDLPDQVELAVAGFGEAMPIACDASLGGPQINRRVELWASPLE